MRVRDYGEILDSKDDVIYIDLRTELEHNLETIPGAINIPIFSDEQRAEIGTLYKQESPKVATERAILFISERLPNIFARIAEIDKERKEMVFFCARGGMRSSSVVGLLDGLKYNAVKLNFGYKGYRAFINEELKKELSEVSFITLYGKTGTGKTSILKELEELGADVLDLEGCANHRGSILGTIGLSEQNSQKMFESLIFDKLRARKSNLIFTEGESRRIGKIVMQEFIFDKIVGDTKVLVESPLNFRIQEIKEQYMNDKFNNEDLIGALNKLGRYIGKTRMDNYIDLAEKGDYDVIIEELMVNYYDINYKSVDSAFEYEITNDNNKETAKKIMDMFGL